MRKRTIEDYVELLYNLQKENEPVHTNDIAHALNFNPASITEIFQKLSKEGYINYEKYSGVTLTKKGKKVAIATKKKHDTIKKFFIILGVDDEIANTDACKIEHIINNHTLKRLSKFVEYVQNFKEGSGLLDNFKKYYDSEKDVD